jgi:hypothetical protein
MRRHVIVLPAALLLAASLMGAAFAASLVVVTPDDVADPAPPVVEGVWQEANIRGDGASVISDEQSDAHGGEASLRQSFSDSSGKTDFRIFRSFGPVGELGALSFDWYRDSSSTAPGHLTPAFEVYVDDGEGNSWLLKWEGAYNGYPTNGPAAPTDQWVTADLIGGNFWRIPQFIDGDWVGFSGCNEAGDPYGCFVFNRQLDDEWLEGFEVVGVGVGIGSGWNGSYISFADHITIGEVTYDFEVDAPPVEVVLDGKDDCKDGGWETSTSPEFKNQGQCVSYFQANERAGKN